MNETNQNRLRLGIIIIAVIAVLINILVFSRPRTETIDQPLPQVVATLIPPEGVMVTKYVGAVPGNPQATVDQMRKIHGKILIFRKKEGCYPQSGSNKSFTSDVQDNFSDYGFRTFQEARQILTNDDIWLSDSHAGKKHSPNGIIIPYFFPGRPDGSSKCTDKSGPGRDILMMTDMYVHMNSRIGRGDTTSFRPIGFYMVLWDDGTVEQIPWEKARFAKDATAYGASPMFEGQYGIEKVQSQTFAEKYHIQVANK